MKNVGFFIEYLTIAMIKSIIVVLKFGKIFYLDQTGLHFLFVLEYPTGPEPINSISYIYYFLHFKKKHFFQETFNKNLFIW